MATKDEKDSLDLNAKIEDTDILTNFRNNGEKVDAVQLCSKILGIVTEADEVSEDIKLLGSTGEGVSRDSDVDSMFVFRNCHVYERYITTNPKAGWLFQMQSCTTNSGYVKLRVKQQGNIQTWRPHGYDFTQVVQYDETSDCYYFANNLLSCLHNLVKKKKEIVGLNLITSGPCLTVLDYERDMDMTMGMKCPEWPSVAAEWISRDRSKRWPSRGFIDQQVMRGCYLVPVGCKECKQTHLDWRISFVHVEQELVRIMNENQIKCYIILKQLKKFFFKVKIPEVITSYVIKTILFWTVEESSPELWQPHQLLTVVQLCLDKLITFVQDGFCPHYFIRTCNLLVRRCSPENRSIVLQTCLEARRNPMKILRQTPLYVNAIPGQHQKSDLQDSLDIILLSEQIQRSLQETLSNTDTEKKLEEYCIYVIEQIDYLSYNNKGRRRQVIQKFQKVIHNVTERLLQICSLGQAHQKELLDIKANCNDEEDVNDIANTCHLLMVTENYTRCHNILGKFVKAQKHKGYSRLLSISGKDINDKNLNNILMNKITHDICGEIPRISDLIFLQLEENILPTPLQTEFCPIMSGNTEVDTLPRIRKTITVDPLVYACFLRFWCSVKMDQNIQKLMARDDMVWCCGLSSISQKSVALNLLAFCHSQLEEYEEAFAVLCQAFREKPVNCSTLVHIANLVNNKIREVF
ncbi:uncharacterized protein LOC132553471 [Ylistrum balloti]|uniref:uncharacterized protein LOC132553471 n=1 Tax=Ylistrum balloti TaxID=509963 RepID=UPI002905C81F|nr:uncharacterized protein LOC132553471 [Ylistrum balloti]